MLEMFRRFVDWCGLDVEFKSTQFKFFGEINESFKVEIYEVYSGE